MLTDTQSGTQTDNLHDLGVMQEAGNVESDVGIRFIHRSVNELMTDAVLQSAVTHFV